MLVYILHRVCKILYTYTRTYSNVLVQLLSKLKMFNYINTAGEIQGPSYSLRFRSVVVPDCEVGCTWPGLEGTQHSSAPCKHSVLSVLQEPCQQRVGKEGAGPSALLD